MFIIALMILDFGASKGIPLKTRSTTAPLEKSKSSGTNTILMREETHLIIEDIDTIELHKKQREMH